MITKKILNLETKNILEEKKHTEHKLLNNDIILKLKECKFIKESEQIYNCSSYLLFSIQQHQSTLEKRKKLKEADFCKFRFCSTCNWRRNLNINKELLKAFELIQAQKDVSYLFLTLTIKNAPTNDLKATVKHLNDSFKRLTKTKNYKDVILGHFKALEILGDDTPAGEIHPHFHIILIVNNWYFKSPKYIHTEKWAEMWQKALRVDYTPIVHVQKIKAKRLPNGKILTALQSAVYEVAKYSVKHTELTKKNNNEFISIINQTKNMRFFSTGGILKDKINLMRCDDDLIQFDEKIELQWKEIYQEIYTWLDGDFRLKEIKTSSN